MGLGLGLGSMIRVRVRVRANQQRHGGGGVGEHNLARGAALMHLLINLPAEELAWLGLG